jgi:hypothetical protein
MIMTQILTKPLIVPEYNNGSIKLYTPNLTGEPTVNAPYSVNLQALLDILFPGQERIARPNCCKLQGVDLFVALSSINSQAVLKLPNYLNNPTTAQTQAFVFTLDGLDYVDLAFDQTGNLYVAEGNFENNQIVRYSGTTVGYPGAAAASNNNYTTRTVIGNGGRISYFANLVFDSFGNLWVTDYFNHRIVAFDAVGLGNGTNSYHILANASGTLAVANTVAGLNATTTRLFSQPEGLDFDSFASTANLWVANNNDGRNGVVLPLTSLIKITKTLQNAVLATPNGGTVTPIAADANTKFFIYQVPNSGAGRPQFGGLQIDKATGRLYVNEQVEGKGRAYDVGAIAATPATSANSVLNIVSTNPGNGGIALLALGAFVADTPLDTGLEPDISTTQPWQSLAISIVQANGGPLATLPPSEEVLGGQPCYLYVEVKNFGATPTLGIERLNLSWAKASAGLSWPKPWDGSVFDLPSSPSSPASPLGGTIQTGVVIPVIPAFDKVVVGPVPWSNAPDPSKYTIQDGHFCLLARVVTPGLGAAGMSFPEGNDLVTNALKNARIAWRNIHIIKAVPFKIGERAGVQLANYGGATLTTRITFEVLNPEGQPIKVPAGSIQISASGPSLAALQQSSLEGVFQGEEPVALPNPDIGIDNLVLIPNQTILFNVDYQPVGSQDAYAVRVSQFAKEAAGERLIGGQTFVNGQVQGFPIKPPLPNSESPLTPSIPKGFWWFLLLILTLFILYLVL